MRRVLPSLVIVALQAHGCTCGATSGHGARADTDVDVGDGRPDDGATTADDGGTTPDDAGTTTDDGGARRRDAEVLFERFDVGTRDCGAWEAAEVTAPPEVPAGVEGLSHKWTYVPGIDPEYRERSVVRGSQLFGPLAERLDGGICMKLGLPETVGCVTRDGRFAWNWQEMPFEIRIVGGPTVLPDGRVVVNYKFDTLLALHPDGPEHGIERLSHQMGRQAPWGRWEWGPAVAAGGLYLVSFGDILTGPDEGIYDPRDIWFMDTCLFPVWVWWDRDPLGPIEGHGAVIGADLVIAHMTDPAVDMEQSLLKFGSDGAVQNLGALPHGQVMLADRDRIVVLNQIRDPDSDRWLLRACTLQISTGATGCVQLEGAVPDLDAVIAPDGAIVATRQDWNSDRPEDTNMVGVWEPTGALRWRYDWGPVAGCLGCNNQVYPPVVGRDGSVLVFLDSQRSRRDGTFVYILTVHLFTPAGVMADSLELENYVISGMHKTTAILARDGTLYYVVTVDNRERAPDGPLYPYGLVAIQTPVPGPAVEDPGWPSWGARTTRRDLWVR